MKLTVEGFFQPQMKRMGLDNTDALILRWFVDFNATNKMKNVLVYDEYCKKDIPYYWVKYSAVLDDLQTININNVRSISRRFQKLVDMGVLQKVVITRHTGSYACFRLNSGIAEKLMCYDLNDLHQEYLPDEEDLLFEQALDEYYQEKERIKHHETNRSYINDEQLSRSTFQTKDTKENELFRSAFQVNISENELLHRTPEYAVTTTSQTLRTPEYGGHCTPEYGALNNQSINNQSFKKLAAALNSESDKFTSEAGVQQKNQLETEMSAERSQPAAAPLCLSSETIKKAIEKIWPLNVFDDEFIPKAARYLQEQSRGDLFPVDTFVQWLKKYVDNKKPDSPWGLFYSLFFKPDILQKFKADPAQHTTSSSPKRANTVICPVCGREFSEYSLSCPVCELLVMEFDNHNIVHTKKQLWKLPEDIRSLLEQKIIERTQNAMRSGQFNEISSITAQLFSEFGIQKEVVT